MSGEWKTVRVFISSTFRDMHAERDHLVKVVFPALRERLLPYRIHVVDIDLRWGVTAKQADNDQALDLCLQQIDECRPLFVGLLGERYGWVPVDYPDEAVTKYGWIQHETGKSITELEILYGVLRNEKMRGHAFFCFRDPAFLGDLPSGRQLGDCAEFPSETEADTLSPREARSRALDRRRKLDALKDAIREAEPPVPLYADYRCHYQGLKLNWRIAQQKLSEADRKALHEIARDGIVDPQEYAGLSHELRTFVDAESVVYLDGLKPFGERLGEQLWAAIQTEHDLPETPPTQTLAEADPLAEEADYHERFMESRLRVYVGGDKMKRALTKFANAEHTVPCLVTGPSGAGKSAALAKFVTTYRESHPDVAVIPHFVGASPRSTDLRQILRRFCQILRNECGFEDEVPQEFNQLTTLFRDFLLRVPDDRRVLFAIDALNQLDETDNAHALNWLPHVWPAHVKLFTSCIDDPDRSEAVLKVFQKRKREHFKVGPLTNEERFEIVHRVPSLSAKSLDGKQIQLLLSNPATTNPLFLLVALEELRGFGSFEELNDRIKHFPRDGDTVTELFVQVLERLEIEFGEELVQSLFQLLASARRGLSEPELQSLTGADEQSENLFPVLCQARAYLQPRGATLDFFHRGLYKAVRSRYLATEAEQLTGHSRLASYFHGLLNPQDAEPWSGHSPRALSELPHHQTEGQSWGDLEATLTSIRFLEAKNQAEMVFDLAADYTSAVAALPPDRPQRRILRLLEEALRRDIHFIARHAQDYPPALFQCLWNSCWWYDNPSAEKHYESPEHGWLVGGPPWKAAGPKLYQLMEEWKLERRAVAPSGNGPRNIVGGHNVVGDKQRHLWLRTLRSPSLPLGSSQVAQLIGHTGMVSSVAFSPDGRRIVSASSDKTVRVWDAESQVQAVQLEGHNETVSSLAFSPDGKRLAACSGGWQTTENSVRVWDAKSGEQVSLLTGHAAWVSCVAFAHDGNRLASGSEDRSVRIWDAASGSQVARLTGNAGAFYCVAFSPDDKRLAAGSEDNTVWVWNAKNERPVSLPARLLRLLVGSLLDYRRIAKLTGHTDKVHCVAFSPDGKRIVSGSWDDTVRVWDVDSGEEIAQLGVKCTPRMQRIMAFNNPGEELAELGLVNYPPEAVAFSPNGKQIFIGASGRFPTVQVWDIDSDECSEAIEGTNDVGAMAAGADAYPYRFIDRGLEAAVESSTTGKPIAWFSASLSHITAEQSGRKWAADNNTHVTIVDLVDD